MTLGLELVGGAVAVVGLVGREEPVGGLPVPRQALHLAVRAVGTAGAFAGHGRTLVPGKSQPMEAVQDVLLVGNRAASLVGVLEPEDERSAHDAWRTGN